MDPRRRDFGEVSTTTTLNIKKRGRSLIGTLAMVILIGESQRMMEASLIMDKMWSARIMARLVI